MARGYSPQQLQLMSANRRLRKLARSITNRPAPEGAPPARRQKAVTISRLIGPGTILGGSPGRASGAPKGFTAQPKTSNKGQLATRQRRKTEKLQKTEWGTKPKPLSKRLRKKQGLARARPGSAGGFVGAAGAASPAVGGGN